MSFGKQPPPCNLESNKEHSGGDNVSFIFAVSLHLMKVTIELLVWMYVCM